ncbi:MAG: metallophosphoesterase [Nitrospinae bacterium]|nr:metallophosphoesterase [Nitrospinota bacterium]
MLIGVVSDTHDRIPQIEKAVSFFNEAGVGAVLHCGDFVAPFALIPFKNLKSPLHAVFGNNDGEKDGLSRMFGADGWTLNDRPHSLELSGKRVSMFHEPARIPHDLSEGNADLIVFGHTHEAVVQKKNGSLLVNPGECCGWIKKDSTVALVDLTSMSARIERL